VTPHDTRRRLVDALATLDPPGVGGPATRNVARAWPASRARRI